MELKDVTDWLKNKVGYVPQEGKAEEPSKGMSASDMALLAGSSLIPAIIAGPKARTAQMKGYHTAMGDLLEGRKTLESIYNRTGWFPRKEAGTIGFEIPDKGMTVKPLPQMRPGGSMEAAYEKFVDHPALTKAYPQIRNYRVKVDPNHALEGDAEHLPGLITLGGEVHAGGLSPKQQAALIHETNHATDKIEGWGQGGNPNTLLGTARRSINNVLHDTDPNSPENRRLLDILKQVNMYPDKYSNKMYMALPAETQERNAQSRFMYDKFGRVMFQPKFSTPDEVRALLDPHGFGLDVGRKNGVINQYQLFQFGGNQPIMESRLPWDARMAYDRLPAVSSKGPMLGERKYPWKTEDLPRQDQFDFGTATDEQIVDQLAKMTGIGQ